MYEIFDESFIAECRSTINVYNTHRSGVGTVFARGEFRRLPELDNLLSNASTAQHCAYILIYIYNAMSGHHADKFYAMAKQIRLNMYAVILGKPEVSASLKRIIEVFRRAFEYQKKSNQADIEAYNASIRSNGVYSGRPPDEIVNEAVQIKAYVFALDVLSHDGFKSKTKVCIDLTVSELRLSATPEGVLDLTENIQLPPNCILEAKKTADNRCTIC